MTNIQGSVKEVVLPLRILEHLCSLGQWLVSSFAPRFLDIIAFFFVHIKRLFQIVRKQQCSLKEKKLSSFAHSDRKCLFHQHICQTC